MHRKNCYLMVGAHHPLGCSARKHPQKFQCLHRLGRRLLRYQSVARRPHRYSQIGTANAVPQPVRSHSTLPSGLELPRLDHTMSQFYSGPQCPAVLLPPLFPPRCAGGVLDQTQRSKVQPPRASSEELGWFDTFALFLLWSRLQNALSWERPRWRMIYLLYVVVAVAKLVPWVKVLVLLHPAANLLEAKLAMVVEREVSVLGCLEKWEQGSAQLSGAQT